MPNLKLNLPPSPGWTKVPNSLLDRMMPSLGDTELRLVLVLARHTFGWNRPNRRSNLTYRHLMAKSGRQSEAVSKALKRLEAKGLIHRERPPLGRKAKNPRPIIEGLYKDNN